MYSSKVKRGTSIMIDGQRFYSPEDMSIGETCRFVRRIYPYAIYIGRSGDSDESTIFMEEKKPVVQVQVPKGKLQVIYNVKEEFLEKEWSIKDGDVIYIEKKPYKVNVVNKCYLLSPV